VVEVKDWAPGIYRQDRSGVVSYANADSWIATDERPRHQANRYRTAIPTCLVTSLTMHPRSERSVALS